MPALHQILLPALGLGALLGWARPAGSAPAAALPQEPIVVQPQEGVTTLVFRPPTKEPWWDTLVVGSRRPERLLRVPEGRRFVLTDLRTLCHEEYPEQQPQAKDRLWLEDRGPESLRVILDARLWELPHEPRVDGGRGFGNYPLIPGALSWETGVVLGPGHELWFQYEFVGDGRQAFLRRVHLAGYFEDLPPGS